MTLKGKLGSLQWSDQSPDEFVVIFPERDLDLKRDLRALRPLSVELSVIDGKRCCLMRFPFRRLWRIGFPLGLSSEQLRNIRDAAGEASGGS